MTRARFFICDPHSLRRQHNQVFETANQLHQTEACLIALLSECDEQRAYVRLGFKSLKGYCIYGLRFTRIQAQRIATEVRRLQQAQTALTACPYQELELCLPSLEVEAHPREAPAGVLRCTDVKDWENGTYQQSK